MLISEKMDFLLLVFAITALPNELLSLEFAHGTFHLDARYNDKLPTSKIVEGLYNTGLIDCGSVCRSIEHCESFFHKDLKCVPYLNRMHDKVSTVPYMGMVYYETKGRLGNLAVGKQTSQSSTANNLTSELAVDGVRLNWKELLSCSRTTNKPSTWRIDLGSVFDITTVAVLVMKSPGVYMENVSIEIGMTASLTDSTTCAVNPTGNTFHDEWGTFRCPQPIKGQHVQIARQGGFLLLCEVEIYA